MSLDIFGKVYGNAQIRTNAQIGGVFIAPGAEVYEDAVLVGNLNIQGKVHGNAKLTDLSPHPSGETMFVGVGSEVYGNAVLTGTILGSPHVFDGGAVYGDVTMVDNTQVYFGAIVRGKVFMSRFAQVFGTTSTPGSGPVVDGAYADVPVVRSAASVVSAAPKVLAPTAHVVSGPHSTPTAATVRAV